jgi:hypothetical protein
VGTYAGILEKTLQGREVDYNKPGIVAQGIDQATGKPNTITVTAEDYNHSVYPVNEAGIFSTGFAKLREVRLSWDAPTQMAQKVWLSQLNLAIVGRNLYTWTKFPNYDPENSTNAGNGGRDSTWVRCRRSVRTDSTSRSRHERQPGGHSHAAQFTLGGIDCRRWIHRDGVFARPDRVEHEPQQSDIRTRHVAVHRTQQFLRVTRFNGAGTLSMTSLFSQHLAQVQYVEEDRGHLRTTTIDGIFSGAYTVELEDFKKAADIGKAASSPNTSGPALVMQSWTYQNLTDLFGDVPYSEALQGDEGGPVKPKYDPQKDIYYGLLKTLTDAAATMKPSGDVGLGGRIRSITVTSASG